MSKYWDAVVKREGSEEAARAYMKKIAGKGGKKGRGHKFAHGKVDPKKANKLSKLGSRAEG